MEKVREQVEFEINVRAENEITKMLEQYHKESHKEALASADILKNRIISWVQAMRQSIITAHLTRRN